MWSDKLFKMSKLGNVVNNNDRVSPLDDWGSRHPPARRSVSESGGDNEDSSPAKMTLIENDVKDVASSSRITIPKGLWQILLTVSANTAP